MRFAATWRQLPPVEQVRPVFLLAAVVNIGATLPLMLEDEAALLPAAAGVAAVLGLGLIYLDAVRRKSFPVLYSALEMIGLALLGFALPVPSSLATAIAGVIYLRGLFGGHWAAIGRVTGYLLVVALVAAVDDLADPTSRPLSVLSWAVPTYLVNAVATRVLYVFLERTRAATDVGAALSRLSQGLLSAGDLNRVHALTEQCVRALVPDLLDFQLTRRPPPSGAGCQRLVYELQEGTPEHRRMVVLSGTRLPQRRQDTLAIVAAQAAGALEAVHLRAALHKRAHYDQLTGLPNRASFLDALAAADPGRPLGLMFIDLDDFKPVNDTFGHAAGDVLLETVGRRLREIVRTGDVVARLGGDEFALLVSGLGGPDEARAVAARVQRTLTAPVPYGEVVLNPACSIGIAMSPPGGALPPDQRAQALLQQADAAMYVGKSQGKNRSWFYGDEPPAQARVA